MQHGLNTEKNLTVKLATLNKYPHSTKNIYQFCTVENLDNYNACFVEVEGNSQKYLAYFHKSSDGNTSTLSNHLVWHSADYFEAFNLTVDFNNNAVGIAWTNVAGWTGGTVSHITGVYGIL